MTNHELNRPAVMRMTKARKALMTEMGKSAAAASRGGARSQYRARSAAGVRHHTRKSSSSSCMSARVPRAADDPGRCSWNVQFATRRSYIARGRRGRRTGERAAWTGAAARAPGRGARWGVGEEGGRRGRRRGVAVVVVGRQQAGVGAGGGRRSGQAARRWRARWRRQAAAYEALKNT